MKELTQELLEAAEALSKEVEASAVNESEEDEDLSFDETEELLQALKKNTPEFNTLKLIEELAELQEKLIKFHLKSPSHKPKLTEILDEMGDVELRLAIFLETNSTEDFDAIEYTEARIEKKMKKLYGYYKEGKYKGGL